MNENTLISVHGYAGDAHQIEALLPVYEHHQCPVYIISPEDSKIEKMGPHSCLYAGLRGYVGQITWDRQHLQMKKLLDFPFEWYLLNDSDSFVLTPELPSYLYEDIDTVYSNEVDDFRIPGKRYVDTNTDIIWPDDYHKNLPLIAMQPPYFMSRYCLKRMVEFGEGLIACPITPFIDWFMVVCTITAGLKHKPFRNGASCETQTDLGIAVMSECITKRDATFIHSIKSNKVMEKLVSLYNKK